MMKFTDILMGLAAWVSPKGHKDWARAMRGEYEALPRGQLGWALGCLTTAAGWRLKVDGVWLAVLFAIPTIYYDVFEPIKWKVYIWAINHDLLSLGPKAEVVPLLFYIQGTIPFVLSGLAMGGSRPGKTWLTATLVMIAFVFHVYVRFLVIFPDLHFPFYIKWNDLPPVVGELVFWIVAVASVWVGERARRLMDRFRHVRTN
jgi:hypothetical protein